jgi:hypothetical protein
MKSNVKAIIEIAREVIEEKDAVDWVKIYGVRPRVLQLPDGCYVSAWVWVPNVYVVRK